MYKSKVTKHEKIILALVLILFTAVALTVTLMQSTTIDPPLFTSPPDEEARYLVPKWIYEHGTLPTGLEAETRHAVYGEFSYAYLPGLSYIIMGYVMKLAGMLISTDPFVVMIAARCVNVLFGILTAVFIWLLARRIFNKERYVWLFVFAVTFLPQHLFIHTYVNTESLCMLSIAVIYHSLVRMIQDKPNTPALVEFAIGASILTLSYYNAYGVLVASVPIFISLYVCRDSDTGKIKADMTKMLRQGGIIIAIWCVLCLWWFIRQGIIFDGDFLGMKIRNATLNAVGQNILKDKGYTFIGMIMEFKPFRSAFINFVATYGSCSILGNILIYRAYKAFYVIGVILLAVSAVLKHKNTDYAYKLFLHGMLLIGDIITVGLWLYYCYCSDYQPQGRYVFPALFHLYWMMIKGYECGIELIPGSDKIKTAVCVCGCTVITGLLLWYVYGYAVPVYLK